jgi:hypothetical protein
MFAHGLLYELGPGIWLVILITPILVGVWLSERGRS